LIVSGYDDFVAPPLADPLGLDDEEQLVTATRSGTSRLMPTILGVLRRGRKEPRCLLISAMKSPFLMLACDAPGHIDWIAWMSDLPTIGAAARTIGVILKRPAGDVKTALAPGGSWASAIAREVVR